MGNTRWVRVLIALATFAFAASACANSESKSSAPDPTDTEPGDASATSTGSDTFVPVDETGVTDEEIRVGGVASVTNPLGGSYASAFEGVKAYFDMVNADGGIYGRKLALVSERDDALANNKSQVEGLLSEDNVFAVLPIASLLFTASDVLVQENVPTFGWTINPQWQGSEAEPKANLFGQSGSYLCFGCFGQTLPWLAQELGAKKIGVIAYSVSESSLCADGVEASFEKYGDAVGASVAFIDQSLAFGNPDYSVQVSKMKEAGVDLVTTCMDTNGVVTLAKEMKKQKLDAVQMLPNAYDHDFLDEFGDLFEGSYVRTDFTQWEVEDKPEGLQRYLDWIDKAGKEPTENSIVGWLNADLFVTGLREAGPNFDRQKVIDSINALTDYTADGIVHPVDWTKAHTERESETETCQFLSKIEDSEFVPVYTKPGKPFVCAVEKDGELTARYDA